MNPVAGTSDDAANEGPSHPVLSTSIGDSVEVSIQFFLDHILPPLHTAIDTDRVVRRLKRKGKNSYRPITLLNRWRGFSKDPALEQRPDDQSFNQLVSVAHAITKACPIKGVTPRYTFNNNQHGCPSASERNAGSFPDGYLLSSERASHPEFGWADIVVAGEYRKKGSAVDERYNMAKVCWSMSNLMQEDPRRRFVFAFTIENTNMTLWFCNRSQIVKSESFNFILEHKTLVHFFLSFIYAEPHQAGFDPTMEARYNEGLFYYDITVRSSDGEKFVYRTLDKISESGAAMILGRGTRVWKAIETKSGEPHGEPVVLKESWVDTDRMREGAVHQAIRDTNYSELDRWLLTVQCHGDVFIGGNTENEQVDLTLAIIKHSYTRQSRYGTRSAAVLEHEMVYNPQPHPRVHYRIVFKEVCKPMRGLSLEGIYLALGEICTALKLNHSAGWVHRDISSGNILLDANGNARLTDLEYAKKLNDDSVREEYIGTANFIAAEVADQCYHYRLHVASDRSYSTEMDSDDLYTMVLNFRKPGGAEQYKDKLSSRLSRVRPKKVEAPFRYNPLHDLESLWWVAVYHLFKREVVSIPGEIIIGENELARREEQRICAGELFCNVRHRDRVMTHPIAFAEKLESLHECVQPIGNALERCRQDLVRTYQLAEKDCASIGCSVAEDLYGRFEKTFFSISKAIRDGSIAVESGAHQEKVMLLQR